MSTDRLTDKEIYKMFQDQTKEMKVEVRQMKDDIMGHIDTVVGPVVGKVEKHEKDIGGLKRFTWVYGAGLAVLLFLISQGIINLKSDTISPDELREALKDLKVHVVDNPRE